MEPSNHTDFSTPKAESIMWLLVLTPWIPSR